MKLNMPEIASMEVIAAIDNDPQAYLDAVFSRPGPFVIDPLVTRAMDRLEAKQREHYELAKRLKADVRVKRIRRARYAAVWLVTSFVLVLFVPHIAVWVLESLRRAGNAFNAPDAKTGNTADVTIAQAAGPVWGSMLDILPLLIGIFFFSVCMRFTMVYIRRITSER